MPPPCHRQSLVLLNCFDAAELAEKKKIVSWHGLAALVHVQCLHGNDIAAFSAVCRNLCSSFPGPSSRPHLPPSWASLRHPRGLRVLNRLALSCQEAPMPPPCRRQSLVLLNCFDAAELAEKKKIVSWHGLAALVHRR